MRKIAMILISFVIIISFIACADKTEFTETENRTVVSTDGTEYTFVGIEDRVWCFGEREFLSHVKGEKKTFTHLIEEIKTGMYSVNKSKDVLVRYLPDNEFKSIYVKSELLKKEVLLDNCIRFEFVKDSILDEKTTISNQGITECNQFLDEIRNGQTAKEAGLYDLIERSDGTMENCYLYGYVCGVLQDDLNLVIRLNVYSFDDKAYSITIDDTEYVLPKEWMDKFITE